MKKLLAIGAAVVIALPVIAIDSSVAKTPAPTQAQIDAAKATEAAKAAAANKAQQNLNSANQTLRQLTAISDAANVKYKKAKAELAVATANALAAAKHAAAAQAEVAATNKTIGKLAANAYKMGGDLTNINSLLEANGPQDLIDRLSTLNNLGNSNSTILDRFKKAEVIAKAAKIEADRTQAVVATATAKVAAAKQVADDAKAAQAKEVARLQVIQNALMDELAKAKSFRITLEQQRQLSLLEEASADIAANTPNQYRVWPDRGFTGRSTIRSTEAIRSAAVA